MGRTKRSGSISMRDAGQAGIKKPRSNLKQSVSTSRMGRHESTNDVLGSEYGVSEGDDWSDDGQNGLDDARNALKNLQAAIEKAERNDTFAKDMEKKVRIDEGRLRNMVKKEEDEWHNEVENFQSQFSSLVKMVLSSKKNKVDLTSSGPAEVTTSDAMQSAGDHPLYLKTQGLLESAKALINGVDSISTHASKIKLPQDPREGFEKDTAEARRLIVHGAEATAMALEKQLVYNKSNTRQVSERKLRGREEEEFLSDNNLQAMFEMGREGLNESAEDGQRAQSWGFVAHQLQKGMRELVKALPGH
ncbi:hypothetical protein MferCBS31731_002219 [Microsporum ferrugineum]